jgi:hypothetical protein
LRIVTTAQLVRRQAGLAVTRVVVEMNALQIRDVAVAMRQHHVERDVVRDETIKVDRRKWEHCFDAVWRSERVIQ